MRGKDRYYKIDSKLLKDQLKARGVPATKASEIMGFSHAYLNSSFRKERLSIVGANLLQSKFNIQPESYVIQEKPKEEEKEPGKYGIDEKNLYSIIYGAVYQAMKRALSE